MKNRIFRTLALGFGLTAIFATSGLNATSFYSQKVNIPFEFRIGHRTYDAGEYRLQQDASQEIAYLVNQKTGRRIQLLRANGSNTPERAKLVFENDGGVHILKRVS